MVRLSWHDIQTGMITALMQRAARQSIPRALSIKQRLEEGGRISNQDLDYLLGILERGLRLKPLFDKYPQLHSLSAQIVQLYADIAQLALENEERQFAPDVSSGATQPR